MRQIKRNFNALVVSILSFLVLIGRTAPAQAQAGKALINLPLEQLLNIQISTATGHQQAVDQTFASVYVITREELALNGASSLAEALGRVPGLIVGYDQFGVTNISVRGIKSRNSEKVLMLLDGHVLNDVRSGSATFQFLDAISIPSVAQIEVVLGPVSSLYGANAFVGVINIITLPPERSEASLHSQIQWDSGGVATRSYSGRLSKTGSSGWRWQVNAHWQANPGIELPVGADALGQQGNAATQERWKSVYVKAANEFWSIKTRWFQREAGDYFGALNVLNGQSHQQVEHRYIDVTRSWCSPSHSEWAANVYVDAQKTDNAYMGVPPGLIQQGPFSAWFNTGYFGRALAQTLKQGAELKWGFHGWSKHQLTVAAGYRLAKLTNPQLFANANPGPLSTVENLSDSYNWIDSAQRETWSIYAQDLWQLTPELSVNADIRWDTSTDYGANVSPRLGLNWRKGPWQLRASAGKAYRAPDFFSMYLKNNVALLGNTELNAEHIVSYELGVSRQVSDVLRLELAGFSSQLTDLIDENLTTTQYENISAVDTRGVTLRVVASPAQECVIDVNATLSELDYPEQYSYPSSPKNSVNASIQWRLNDAWGYHVSAAWRSKAEREAIDTRQSVASYEVLDVGLRRTLSPSADLHLSLKNSTDTTYYHASLAGGLQEDYIAPGRSVAVSLRWAL